MKQKELQKIYVFTLKNTLDYKKDVAELKEWFTGTGIDVQLNTSDKTDDQHLVINFYNYTRKRKKGGQRKDTNDITYGEYLMLLKQMNKVDIAKKIGITYQQLLRRLRKIEEDPRPENEKYDEIV